jgi:hypothetical protein
MAQHQRASRSGKASWSARTGSEKVTGLSTMVKDWTRPNFGMVSDEWSVADHFSCIRK